MRKLARAETSVDRLVIGRIGFIQDHIRSHGVTARKGFLMKNMKSTNIRAISPLNDKKSRIVNLVRINNVAAQISHIAATQIMQGINAYFSCPSAVPMSTGGR